MNVQTAFADSVFFIGLLDRSDQHHAAATAAFESFSGTLYTSQWVLTEVGNHLSAPPLRQEYVRLVEQLKEDNQSVILEVEGSMFSSGLSEYRRYHDKNWSLVDCTSMLFMRANGVVAVLSNDHHFMQMGFTLLM